jgi:hypothetical protein
MIRIVLHGVLPAAFRNGLAVRLAGEADICVLPHQLGSESAQRNYAAADVIVSSHFDAAMLRPASLKLLHPGGQVKVLHSWPGQIPPADARGRMMITRSRRAWQPALRLL